MYNFCECTSMFFNPPPPPHNSNDMNIFIYYRVLCDGPGWPHTGICPSTGHCTVIGRLYIHQPPAVYNVTYAYEIHPYPLNMHIPISVKRSFHGMACPSIKYNVNNICTVYNTGTLSLQWG